MRRMAVAIINFKGGVGKTSLACILTQIALSKKFKVTAIDLDPQRNFSDSLTLVKNGNPELEYLDDNVLKITTQITDEGDIMIIDCPPVLIDKTEQAMDFADIVLIPVMPELFSVANLGHVYTLAEAHEKGREQMALVKVGFDKRALGELVSSNIDNRGYNIAAEVPINRLIPYNIAAGRVWQYGTGVSARKPFYKLFDALWKEHKNLLDGKHDLMWRG